MQYCIERHGTQVALTYRMSAILNTLREYLFARFLASVARHGTVVLRSYASKQTKIYLPRVPSTHRKRYVKHCKLLNIRMITDSTYSAFCARERWIFV